MSIRRLRYNLSAIFSRERFLPHSETTHNDHPLIASWRPIYLRRLVIWSFILALCSIIAALEVLNHISQSRNGLASSVERLHYLWTYTPTAILTVISALWARTEFQAKQNAPWRSLREPEGVDKSLLLDYDNIPPVALWKSFKNGHFVVAAGISCTLLLQLAILFSTSVLSLQSVHVQRTNVPVQLEDIFDGTHPTFNDTKLEAFDVLNGVQFENMTYPSGTNADLAFQRFSAPSASQGSVITVPIKGMESTLDCEHATLKIDRWEVARTNDSWGGSARRNFSNQITSPSCTIFNATLDDYGTGGWSPYVARMKPVACDNSTDIDRNRFLAFAVEYHIGRMVKNVTTDIPTFWTRAYELVLDRSIQLICKPRLSTVSLQATVNLTESQSIPYLKTNKREETDFKNFNAWNISEQVTQGWYQVENFGSDRPIAQHTTFVNKGPMHKKEDIDLTIQLGAWIAGKTGDVQSLFQNNVLEEAVSAFYRSMAAQIIRTSLMKQRSTQTSGSTIFDEDRVLVIQSPLRVLEACLATVALMAVAVLFLGPSDGSFSQNPSNILTIANIVSNSPALRQSLRRAGALSLSNLREKIHGYKYFLRNYQQDASIEIYGDKLCVDADVSQTLVEDLPVQTIPSWKPFPSLWFKVSIFSAIAGTIITLESLLQISQKKNGLGEGSTEGKTHYLWTTVPSLIMMLIALSIGSLDSNTRMLAPYACLQSSKGVSFEALGTNFLDALRITNLYRSIQTRNLAIFSTTLAALIASFLTIVTSGLFSAVEVPQILSVNFTQETMFTSPNVLNLTEDTPDFSIANYILIDNLTYPKWTYKDLVFPQLSLDAYSNSSNNGEFYADVRVTAIRGSTDCVFATGPALNINMSYYMGFPDYDAQGEGASTGARETLKLMAISMDLPTRDCPAPGSNETEVNLGTSTMYFAADGYFGQTMPADCHGTDEASRSSLTSYVWGYIENRTVQHMSAMTCAGKTESVSTVTRFQLPGFDIPTSHPPIPEESSAKTVPNINGVWNIYQLDRIDFSGTEEPTAASFNIDNFFTALVEGRYKIPKKFLGSPQYDSRVQEAIKHQESIVRAQPLKRYARIATNGSLDHEPVMGNMTLSNHLRVFQDKFSTRVLEAMLGLVLLFSILGSMLMNTDHILPKNPMSIAAVGSLLADANFLHFCSHTEWNSNRELLRRYRVHLGWLNHENARESLSGKEEPNGNRYLAMYMSADTIKEGFSTDESLGSFVRRDETDLEGGYI